MVALTTVGVLGLVTVVGGALAAFGRDLTDTLVAWTGLLAGGALGAAGGWLGAPVVASGSIEAQIGLGVAGVFVGAIFGRLLFPTATRLATLLTGFVATAGSTLVVLVGSDVTRVLATVEFEGVGTLATTVERLVNSPAFQSVTFQRSLAIGLVVGILGAAVAVRYHELVLAAAVTAIGAGLLAVVVPLWQRALTGDLVGGGGLTNASPVWFVVAFLAGVGVQYARTRSEESLERNPLDL